MVLAFALLFVVSCEDDFESTTYPETAYTDKGGSLVQITDVQTGFFDQVDPSSSVIGFTIGTEGGEDVSSMDVSVSYNGVSTVVLESVTSFPATISAPFQDVLAAVGVSEDVVAVGDNVLFTLTNVKTPSGTFGGSSSLNIPVSCDSKFGGTFDYVSTGLVAANGYDCPTGEVTGTVTFEPQGGGKYLVSDLGFGQYESGCWNDGPATSSGAIITDVCNELTTGGLDQYGLVYTWVITNVDGPNLSLTWTNTYGDGGSTTITRPDGSDWPQLYTN